MRLRSKAWIGATVAVAVGVIWWVAMRHEPESLATTPAIREGANHRDAPVPVDRMAPRQVPASASVVVTAQPQKTLGHDLAPDLYLLATMAAASSDANVLYDGFLAAVSCMQHSRRELDTQLARGGTDAIAVERKRAAREVQQRCYGFLNNDDAANRELRQRLRRKIREMPGFDAEYWPGQTDGEPADAQIATAFERGNVEAFSSTMSTLLPRLLARAGIEPRSHDAGLWAAGWLEAACDIGLSCGPDGLSYLAHCASSGVCPGSWDAFYRIGINDEDAPRIFRHRQAIAAAFIAKDMKFFGLAP